MAQIRPVQRGVNVSLALQCGLSAPVKLCNASDNGEQFVKLSPALYNIDTHLCMFRRGQLMPQMHPNIGLSSMAPPARYQVTKSLTQCTDEEKKFFFSQYHYSLLASLVSLAVP